MYNGGKETELSEETCSGLGVSDNLPEREKWIWDPRDEYG